MSNALAALAAARAAGVSLKDGAKALADYRGIGRRFEIVGTARDITVIDDFAHNPDKIAATLRTLHERPGRVIAIFQPHGFAATRLMRAELVRTFAEGLEGNDILVMPEIYYAGGTVTKDISSADIINDVAAAGRQSRFIEKRSDIVPLIAKIAQSGDRIIIMGARDDTLPGFARDILTIALVQINNRLPRGIVKFLKMFQGLPSLRQISGAFEMRSRGIETTQLFFQYAPIIFHLGALIRLDAHAPAINVSAILLLRPHHP